MKIKLGHLVLYYQLGTKHNDLKKAKAKTVVKWDLVSGSKFLLIGLLKRDYFFQLETTEHGCILILRML